MKSMYVLEPTWKQQRRMDTSQLESNADADQVLISDCEELVGVAQRSECHFLKLNGTLEAQFDFV